MRPESILAGLDKAWTTSGWPSLAATDAMFAVHTTRMLAYVLDDNWAVLFEQIRGDHFTGDEADAYGAKLHYFACGSEFATPHTYLGGIELPFTQCTIPDKGKPGSLEGCSLRTTTRTLIGSDQLSAELDLRPDKMSERFILMLRAWLARYPGTLYPSLETIRDFVGATEPYYENIVVSDAYEHVVSMKPKLTNPELRRFQKKPSTSPVFQSLANALAKKDASLFEPGESNLDWRRWAGMPTPKQTPPTPNQKPKSKPKPKPTSTSTSKPKPKPKARTR